MSGDGSVTVVPESRGQVTFLWGFLAVVSALVVFRAITGDMSGAGLYVAVGLFGALLAGSVLMGVWSLRHPGQVDVSAGSIVHRYRGQPRATTLTRATGELYVRRVVLNAKHPQA